MFLPPLGKRLPQDDAGGPYRERFGGESMLAGVFGTAPAKLKAIYEAGGRRRVVNDRIFGIHGAALELRSQRMGVLASNIANAATPGFKARDIDFAAALDAKLDRDGAAGREASHLVYKVPTMASLDGNTVELAREQIAFAENAMAYSATLSFVQGKVNTITRALKGE